ncbi:alpha/beta fold hydrolase [Fictibacillus aquaticus]|uniref:alpha/beta fold hydrolase n=1 Tax=Fictibacillus aquaticus TaxID=2021314 RepID=UPI0013FE3BC2|nr:alpha/beta hydrolase [Fictibacillus aquaticus]
MKVVQLESAEISYRIFGEAEVKVVIVPALGSCSAEWWHLAERFSKNKNYSVLVYDRAGYGMSSPSSIKRTPRHVAEELAQLLSKLNVTHKVVLVGHSQGGLYIQQFARAYPHLVKGLVLVDPLSANDNIFKIKLTEELYKKSGVNKLKALRIGYWLTSFKLGTFFVPVLKKAPPFYYYNHFSKEAETYILKAFTKPMQYKTAIEEYHFSHDEEEIAHLKEKGNFPDIALKLITHTPRKAMEEIIYYGGTTEEEAQLIDEISQKLMKEYLTFSSKSELILAKNSSHYIHLTEPELIKKAIEDII